MDAQSTDSNKYAEHARFAKRAAAISAGIDEAFVSSLVERFYAAVLEDPLLAPIFAEKVDDWPHHLEQMKRFWRSVLHNSGEYRGQPMPKHIAIAGLSEEHFSRWLELFYATLRLNGSSLEASQIVGGRARSIADSLLTGIALRRDGVAGFRAGMELPHV